MKKQSTAPVRKPVKTYALSWASGLITFSRKLTKKEKDGAIIIASGNGRALKRMISAIARHGYRDGVLLVPGIPEARTDEQRLDALQRFIEMIRVREKDQAGLVQALGSKS